MFYDSSIQKECIHFTECVTSMTFNNVEDTLLSWKDSTSAPAILIKFKKRFLNNEVPKFIIDDSPFPKNVFDSCYGKHKLYEITSQIAGVNRTFENCSHNCSGPLIDLFDQPYLFKFTRIQLMQVKKINGQSKAQDEAVRK